LGLDWSRREARARRADDDARRALHESTARWEPDAKRLRELIDTARTLGTDQAPTLLPGCPVALKYGEIAFYWLPSVSLVETSLERDQCTDGYSGCSLQVLRNVEWQFGATRGTVEPGPDAPAVLDVGSVTITNMRVVFQGPKQARVWAFSKLLGTQDDAATPRTAIAVSNHQRVLGVQYTEEEAEEFRFRLHLALAEQRGDRAAIVTALENERAQHDAARPEFVPPGPQGSITSPLRDFNAWPRWARIAVPSVVIVLLGMGMGAVTEGQAKPTFEAQTPLASLLPTTPPIPPATTRTPRLTTTRLAASTTRTTRAPGTTPTTASRTRPTDPPPAGSVVAALSPAPAHGRRHGTQPTDPPLTSPPTTAPPVTDPPTTTPPVTGPPTTTPPSTDPPTTTPPSTDPPTTTPPSTDPPTTEPPSTSPPTTEPPDQQSVEPGDPCSTLGATGHTPDGSTVVCAVVLDGLNVKLRWVLV
jgi:hypothetical protein